MSVKERLTEYLKVKQISKTEFCRSINVSNAFISSMRKSIQPDKIESIALKYPDLNIGWLMTGKGDMLKSKVQPEGKMEQPDIMKLFSALSEDKNKFISYLEKRVDELTEERNYQINLIAKYRQMLEEKNKILIDHGLGGEIKDIHSG